MTQRSSPVETSLLYPTKSAPIGQIDVSALRSLLTMLDVTPLTIRTHNTDYILIDCAEVEAVIVGCDVAFPADHFDGAAYPGADTPVGKAIRADLAGHGSSLTVVVVDKEGATGPVADADLNRRIGWHVLYLLMEMTRPQLVFWCADDRLMTPQMATEAIKTFHRETPFSPCHHLGTGRPRCQGGNGQTYGRQGHTGPGANRGSCGKIRARAGFVVRRTGMVS